jgi:hypothetical protein
MRRVSLLTRNASAARERHPRQVADNVLALITPSARISLRLLSHSLRLLTSRLHRIDLVLPCTSSAYLSRDALLHGPAAQECYPPISRLRREQEGGSGEKYEGRRCMHGRGGERWDDPYASGTGGGIDLHRAEEGVGGVYLGEPVFWRAKVGTCTPVRMGMRSRSERLYRCGGAVAGAPREGTGTPIATKVYGRRSVRACVAAPTRNLCGSGAGRGTMGEL